MPYAPLKSCTWPGCPNLVRRGHCDQHTARNLKKDTYYSRASWRKTRAKQLADHPMCEHCGRHVGTRGHVDHILARRQGGSDDAWNLMTLCHSCHSKKTNRVDGGLGNKRPGQVGESDSW